jgi:hypothetical protein
VNIPSGWETYASVYAGVFFLALVGVATKSELRTLLLGLLVCTLAPISASPFVAAVLALILKGASLIHIGG